MTYTTSPIQLTDGIEKLLRFIGKELAHELAMMMTIALRFIPTLIEETDKIMKAQKARGANFEQGNIIQKEKTNIFGIICRRADELALAMESRCYRGGMGRTRMNEIKFKKRDFIAFILAIIYLAIAISVRFVDIGLI